MSLKEYLEKIYLETSDNIKFAEAKNAALITLNSALIAFISTMIFDKNIILMYRITLLVFIAFLAISLLFSLLSFRATTGSENCIIRKFYKMLDSMNTVPLNPQMNMYYSYIHKYYDKSRPDSFLDNIPDITCCDKANYYYKQMVQQIVDLSGIAYRKYTIFNIAICVELFSFIAIGIVAFIFLLFR